MSLSYKQFDETDLAELRKICAPERVIPGAGISEDYCHDELSGTFSRPDALVKAMSAEEVSAIMKYASANGFRSRRAARGPGWSAARSRCSAASWSTSPA